MSARSVVLVWAGGDWTGVHIEEPLLSLTAHPSLNLDIVNTIPIKATHYPLCENESDFRLQFCWRKT